MTLHQEQPTAGKQPWSESGKELLLIAELWVRENGGYGAAYKSCLGNVNHFYWTKTDMDYIIHQYNLGNLYPTLPGRSNAAIQAKLSILKKRGVIKRLSLGRWSDKEMAHLYFCFINKLTPKLDGRSNEAIIEKMHYMGLSTKGLKLRRDLTCLNEK